MKTTVFRLCLVIMCITLIQSSSGQTITTPYNYPLRPGMPQWRNLRSQAQKLAALQVPDSVLGRMSTEALINTCLDYPFLFLYTAYSDSLGGMAHVIAGFNGLQELIRRKDAGLQLLKTYQAYDPLGYGANWTLVEKGDFVIRLTVLELLLSHDSILTQLNSDGRLELLAQVVQKAKTRANDRLYSFPNLEASARLAGRIMLKENFTEYVNAAIANNRQLRFFDGERRHLDADEINEMLRHAGNLIDQKH
jgi:hypothetical protein